VGAARDEVRGRGPQERPLQEADPQGWGARQACRGRLKSRLVESFVVFVYVGREGLTP
jgi:hypothetical protein